MKLTFNIVLLTSLAGFSLQANIPHVQPDANTIRIQHPIIGALDGASFGINGESIGFMMQVYHEVRKILFGKANQTTKKFEGLYEFNNELHCAVSLAKIESECNAKFYAYENSLIHDTALHSSAEWHAAKAEYDQQKAALHSILLRIKDDFKRITKSYVEGARGFKEQILILIHESCKLRKLDACFLLKWSEAEEGEETDAFDKEIMTFESMVTFLTDLMNFLKDMVNSCDKGREQFMAKIRAKKTNS